MEKLSENQKNRVTHIIFYCAFIMEIIIRSLSGAGIDIPHRTALLYLATLLFGVKVLLTHYTKKEWCVIALAGIISCIPFITIRETIWIQIICMVIAAKDIDRNQCLKLFFYLLLFTMLGMGIFSACGVLDNFVQVKDFERGGIEVRYCFGYGQPNVFYSNLLLLTSLGILTYHKRLKGIHYLLFTLINLFFLYLVASRNGFVTIQLLILGAYVVYKWPEFMNTKFVYWLGYIGMGGCIVSSFWLLLSESRVEYYINRLLTGRVTLAKLNAPVSTWTLLPNMIDRQVLDMGFINLMARWGILFGCLYIAYMIWVYRRLHVKQDFWGVLIILVYTVFTMIESHAFSMYFVGNLMYLIMIGWGQQKDEACIYHRM